MTILHSGTSKQYSSNWEKAFGPAKGSEKAAAKKSSAKKAATKKPAAKKKSGKK